MNLYKAAVIVGIWATMFYVARRMDSQQKKLTVSGELQVVSCDNKKSNSNTTSREVI